MSDRDPCSSRTRRSGSEQTARSAGLPTAAKWADVWHSFAPPEYFGSMSRRVDQLAEDARPRPGRDRRAASSLSLSEPLGRGAAQRRRATNASASAISCAAGRARGGTRRRVRARSCPRTRGASTQPRLNRAGEPGGRTRESAAARRQRHRHRGRGCGGDGPPVLLIHGWPDTHALWAHQVAGVERRRLPHDRAGSAGIRCLGQARRASTTTRSRCCSATCSASSTSSVSTRFMSSVTIGVPRSRGCSVCSRPTAC